MKNFLLKIFMFLNIETSFSFSNNLNNFNNLNNLNNLNNKIIIPKYSSKIYKNKNINMNINHNICPEYLEKFTNLLNVEQSEQLVKGVTGFLTKVDGFGGYVLHSNDVIINYILNNDLLPLEQKKSIILFFIKLSQYGDSTGSHILQFYHDLVNCLL
jgi:hypothetical protein